MSTKFECWFEPEDGYSDLDPGPDDPIVVIAHDPDQAAGRFASENVDISDLHEWNDEGYMNVGVRHPDGRVDVFRVHVYMEVSWCSTKRLESRPAPPSEDSRDDNVCPDHGPINTPAIGCCEGTCGEARLAADLDSEGDDDA